MYTDFFKDSDKIIIHLKNISPSIDFDIQKSYAGFVCITAVATYEVVIRQIFVDFCKNQNLVFGNFFDSKFSRLNGNIELKKLQDNFLDHFGNKYSTNFKELVDFEDDYTLKTERKKLKESYASLINYRNSSAHTATFNYNATLNDVCDFYFTSKKIIDCLNIALCY